MTAEPNVRRVLLAVAAARSVLAIAAIPLAPFLYREHVAVLVLLRPTKEVLLFAGYALHNHDVSLGVLLVAAAPILLGGVWLFFGLGRVFGPELRKRDLPGVARRILPRSKITRLQAAVAREGDKVVFLGRLAAMPSSLIAAAAGSSGVETRRFLIVDAAGGACSFAVMVGLGWLLEDAFETAGPWLTGAGVLVLAVIAVVIGRALGGASPARRATRGAASKRRNGPSRQKSPHPRRAARARRG